MVVDIKMCRFDSVPWGFRLVGGSDFEYPLTVVKVNEASIAEEAGLRTGDIVVRINDIPATPLTHEEANKIILGCGNVFYFGVYREDPEPEEVPKHFPVMGGIERPATPDSSIDISSSCKSPVSFAPSEDNRQEEFNPELPDRPCSVLSETTETRLVEDEIAAVLSGETEVLKEHQVLGVNFYRIFPKPGVCMTSDVLRTLNEEAVKTKAEKDKENKKWTTFLQRPDRPIPKSKLQIEAELRAANAYKVKIQKSEPRDRSVTPARVKSPEPEPETVAEPIKEPTPEPEVVEPPPEDSEVPDLQEVPIADEEKNGLTNGQEEKVDTEKEAIPEAKESNTEEEAKMETEIPADVEAPQSPPEPLKTEEELALERQLTDVQRQLAALSSLPSTIQATLDAVTKQLASLLPTFKLQQQTQQEVQPAQPREVNLEKIDEQEQEQEQEEREDGRNMEQRNASEDREKTDTAEKDAGDGNDMEVAAYDRRGERIVSQPRQEETAQIDEEQTLKKQKPHDVIEELEERLERNKNPKRSKRAFGPLTPSSERPLVLPGGRRWYRPKDAYNDEFIAETLSAQAELITGTTLGVNFMKYQKPERKIDLNRSEVYKVIHHLDRQPVRGIEVRPPVVAAEVDIRKAVHS